MLQIKDICKKYVTGDLTQVALDHVSLNLRDNEFVAILGPSGSGKTTLLNIIGGLDRYDSGDLIIDGVSTKKYKDRDWDSYRNHTIGFVFQSYNLIPHQTVLQNVELALTIGGISKAQRKQMALDALEKVGLKEQAHKKPNQMSGGQMQRVAIARALVNNPKILLADEPTGALDTKTSVQVMDLLKEVAADRLVVMVTHNPELAEQYANRIVRVKDGSIIDDSNPLHVSDEAPAVHKNLGKASMSVLTSFGLSLNNLMTKKGRTILTAFAGSIGIIGIALILALSTGFQNYINQIQEETMNSYPLTIYQESGDLASAILTMRGSLEMDPEENTLYEMQFISSITNSVSTNDLKSFKSYLETHTDEYDDMVSLIKYSYSVTPLIYTIDSTDTLAQINPSSAMSSLTSSYSSLMSSYSMGTFQEATDIDIMKEDYDLLYGEWPDSYNELVLVVADPNQISDFMLYSLGFREVSALKDMIQNLYLGEDVVCDDEPMTITYDDVLNLDMRLINPTDMYSYNSKYDIYEDMSDDDDYMMDVYDNSEKLKIVGIVYEEGSDGSAMSSGVYYMPELVSHVMDLASESPIVKKQLRDKDTDVFSGNPFDEEEEESGLNFEDMISIDEDKLSEAFVINSDGLNISSDDMQKIVMATSETAAQNIDELTASMTSAVTQIDSAFASAIIEGYKQAGTITVTTALGSGPFVDGDATKGVDMTQLSAPEIAPDVTGAVTMINTYMAGNTRADAVIARLQSASTKAEADAVIDTYCGAMDATVTSRLKAGITQQYGEISGYEQVNGIYVETAAGYTETRYLTTAYTDAYKSQAITDATVARMTAQITDVDVDEANAKRIITEAFDNYYGSLQTTNGLIAYDSLPDTTDAVNKAVTDNSSRLFEEGYNLAKDYMTYMVAQGTAEAVTQVMSPITKAFSGDSDLMTIDTDKFASAFKFDMDEDELSRLMTTMLSGGDTSYSNNLLTLGYQDPDEPTSISIYFPDFASKNSFTDYLTEYNDKADEEQKLTYTDITGILMSSVETIVNAVTYVLIAFVSISLVVSSIMIGIITYISVLERTKEIGILRAIGASKRNISSIFNCETFIIGFLSGVIGVTVSRLRLIPINHVIHSVTGINDITAVLVPRAAAALVAIATILTMIGGFIPSQSASKKDPVKALRTE